MKGLYWKVTAFVFIGWSIAGGLFIPVPDLPVVGESVRNLFYHVCMWFTMVALFIYSLICSIKYLSSGKEEYDTRASIAVKLALFFGVLGIVTGMIWAGFTWGRFWINDPKLNGSLISLLAYLAYLVLRNSVADSNKRGRLASVYNIFAFIILLVFIFILPRVNIATIHPGSTGNPALPMNMSIQMRFVFYPAVIGWVITGFWIFNIILRINKIKSFANV